MRDPSLAQPSLLSPWSWQRSSASGRRGRLQRGPGGWPGGGTCSPPMSWPVTRHLFGQVGQLPLTEAHDADEAPPLPPARDRRVRPGRGSAGGALPDGGPRRRHPHAPDALGQLALGCPRAHDAPTTSSRYGATRQRDAASPDPAFDAALRPGRRVVGLPASPAPGRVQPFSKSTTTGAWSEGFFPLRASRSRKAPVARRTRSSLTSTRSMRSPRP